MINMIILFKFVVILIKKIKKQSDDLEIKVNSFIFNFIVQKYYTKDYF